MYIEVSFVSLSFRIGFSIKLKRLRLCLNTIYRSQGRYLSVSKHIQSNVSTISSKLYGKIIF